MVALVGAVGQVANVRWYSSGGADQLELIGGTGQVVLVGDAGQVTLGRWSW